MSKCNIISKGISRDYRRSIKNQIIRFDKDVTNRFIGIQNDDNRISRSNFLNINNSFKNIPGNTINLKHTSNIEILSIKDNEENDFDDTNNINVFDSKNRENFIENNEDITEDCEDNYFDNEDSIPDHIRQLYYDNYENPHNNGKSLFKGAHKTTTEFLARFLSIKLKDQVSDNTAEKFLKTLKGIKNELSFFVPDVSNIFENTYEHVYDNGRLLKFYFMDLIKFIITRNIKYFLRNYNGETRTLNLLFHTDGAPLSKSSNQCLKFSWIYLQELTNQSEDFNIICNKLRSELKNKVYSVKGSYQNKDINFYYRINIESITGNIPALRKANNLTGCNGSYGCTYCFHKGAYAKTGSGAENGV
uniref:Radical SAM protein n=1 Tax=Strongyloides venezuelensis TaxID=75913 RepID=A0A0K0FP80_STRVS